MTDTLGMRALGEVDLDVLESVYVHRLLTTPQLRRLHTPAGETRDPRWMQKRMAALARRGLVTWRYHRGRSYGRRCWFVTQAGADSLEALAGDGTHRRVLVTPEGAAGIHQAHTLAVNEVGLAFAEWAKHHGDECGPLAWEHEVAHRLRDGSGGVRAGDVLVADAVLHYTAYYGGGRTSLLYRFVELDRATTTAQQLGEKLRRYVAYSRYVPANAPDGQPAWQSRYPGLPAVLLVLTGKPRHLLERRRRMLAALTHVDPVLANAERPGMFTALLEDLQTHGPFAGVFRRVDAPDTPVDVVGSPATDPLSAVAAAEEVA